MAGLPNAELFVEWKTGVPMALADTNRSTFMPSGTSAAPGLVPAPPLVAGAVLFLREDGTWAQATPGTASVTNSMLATMAEATFKGRASGAGAGSPQDLTASEATAILNIFVSASVGKKGLVPAPTTTDVGKVLGTEGWVEGVRLLAVVTVAGSASVISFDLSSYTNYKSLQLKMWELIPPDNYNIGIRFSTTGVTYDTTSYQYVYMTVSDGLTPTRILATTDNYIQIGRLVGNATAEGFNGIVDFIGFAESTRVPRITFQGHNNDGSSGIIFSCGGGNRKVVQQTLGIQVIATTATLGSFTAGEVYLYGYR